MSDPNAFRPFPDFGALRFQGPDTRKFLQGQLSNDMQRLRPGAIVRAGLHNPQGRTIALLWLAALSAEEVLALLPLELVAPVATHLRRYLLRARLSINDVSAETRIHGARFRNPESPASQAATPALWSFDAERALLIDAATATTTTPLEPEALLSREQWRQLDVAVGEPQVYAATSGQFVAQMLNLDCIDALSFDKGCYTGQEVIARAHFRGRVKRRMQRFETLSAARLVPGDSGQFEDGRAFRVVESYVRSDGRCEFLAVAPLPAAAAEEPRTGAPVMAAAPLPLRYALPD